MIGEPAPVAAGVYINSGGFNAFAVSTSQAGPIAYRSRAERLALHWVDRTGRPLATVGEPDEGTPLTLRLSRDGGTAAVRRTINGNADIFLIDLLRGVPRRLTFEPTRDTHPIWSPDGKRVVFGSERTGVFNLFERPADGVGPERQMLVSSDAKLPNDWSPDGKFILYTSLDPKADRDVMAMRTSDGMPIPVAAKEFDERDARFSPDGHWIAYSSDETGTAEVYVQPFPGPGRVLRVSADGGDFPEWRGDGREIFYFAPDNRLMAVPIRLGQTVEVGKPELLFRSQSGNRYTLSPDGQRFLVYTQIEGAAPFTILLSWAGVKR